MAEWQSKAINVNCNNSYSGETEGFLCRCREGLVHEKWLTIIYTETLCGRILVLF